MTVRRTAAALVVVPLFALASCGGDPHKPPPYTPSPTPTESTSPTPTGPVAPTLPAAAQGSSRAAAKAFVSWYVDALNYAQATGHVAEARSASAPSCAGCSSILDSLATLYSGGGKISGGAWKPVGWGILVPRRGSDFAFTVTVRTGPQTVVDESGKRTTYPGGTDVYDMEVVRTSDEWRMTWLKSAG